MTKTTHRSKPRLRGRHAAQPLGGVAAAGVGARRRDRPRAARGDGRRLRPHRRRRDLLADDPAPGGRDPLPRARAGAAIALASSFRPLQPLGGSPVPACSCSSPSTTTIPPPRSKIMWTHRAQAQASYVAGSPVPLPLASVLQAASLAPRHTREPRSSRSSCNTREATEASTALQPSVREVLRRVLHCLGCNRDH